MSAEIQPIRKTKLSETPLVHPTADVRNTRHSAATPRSTSVAQSRTAPSAITPMWSSMARSGVDHRQVRQHRVPCAHQRAEPSDLAPTLHHFTYRAENYWPDAEAETEFFDWRRENAVTIGHDVCARPWCHDPAGRDDRQWRGDRRRRGRKPRFGALHDRRGRACQAHSPPLSRDHSSPPRGSRLVGLEPREAPRLARGFPHAFPSRPSSIVTKTSLMRSSDERNARSLPMPRSSRRSISSAVMW